MSSEAEKIAEAYQDIQLLDERAGNPITPGSSVYDRAAVGAQKFITGHGGGISQMVGGALGTVIGAKNMAGMTSSFKTEETANWLYTQLVPVLKRHNNQITVAQLEQSLARIPITKGGPNINTDQLTVLKGYQNKSQILGEEDLKELLEQISSQLQEIAVTGQEAKMNYDEFFKHVTTHFQALDIAAVMTQYTVGGQVANTAGGEPVSITVILPPPGFEAEVEPATPTPEDIATADAAASSVLPTTH